MWRKYAICLLLLATLIPLVSAQSLSKSSTIEADDIETLLKKLDLPAGQNNAQRQLTLTGKVKDGKYFFPTQGVVVAVPKLVEPGAKVRDDGDEKIWQVIFTDDFGAFYRVIVLDKRQDKTFTRNGVRGVFKQVIEQTVVKTERGEELRVIDLAPESAEISLTTIEKAPSGKWMAKRVVPDLLTANAAFETPSLVIHVAAGSPMQKSEMAAQYIPKLKQRLNDFLAGLELTEKQPVMSLKPEVTETAAESADPRERLPELPAREVLKYARLLCLRVESAWYNNDKLERELLKRKEFGDMGLELTREEKYADLVLEITRKKLTTRFTCTMIEPRSKRIVGATTASSLGGEVEPHLADAIVKEFKSARTSIATK